MGWIGRLAPAVPLLALSLPVRSILGIVLVFLSLGTLAATLSQAWTLGPWSGSWPVASKCESQNQNTRIFFIAST